MIFGEIAVPWLESGAVLYVGFPLTAFILSLLFTGLAVAVLPRLGYLDNPGGRHIHRKPVPRGGGIAVIAAFFIVSFCAEKFCGADSELMRWATLPCLLIAALGIFDDRFDLNAFFKLGVQILAVLLIWRSGLRFESFFGLRIPVWLAFFLQTGWLLYVLNAFNLIDGLDGLATGLSVLASGTSALLFFMTGDSGAVLPALILCGCCCGFLCFNFHPAKIFLGDTGSTFLGLFFGIISIYMTRIMPPKMNCVIPLLVMSVPLLDVTLAILRRIVRRLLHQHAKSVFSGDSNHLHHRLSYVFNSQLKAVLMLYLVAAGFSLAAVILLLDLTAVFVVYVLWGMVTVFVINKLAVIEIYDSCKLIKRTVDSLTPGTFANLIHPMVDIVLVSVAFYGAKNLSGDSEPLSALVMFHRMAVIALVLYLAGIYRVHWMRTGFKAHLKIFSAVFLGTLLSVIFTGILSFPSDGIKLAEPMLFISFSTLLIVWERLAVHYASSYLLHRLYVRYYSKSGFVKSVIYGGGVRSRAYATMLYSGKSGRNAETIIGIIDDNMLLTGKEVYGLKVLGDSWQLEQVYAEHPFQKLVISIDCPSDDAVRRIAEFCRANGVECVHMRLAFEKI